MASLELLVTLGGTCVQGHCTKLINDYLEVRAGGAKKLWLRTPYVKSNSPVYACVLLDYHHKFMNYEEFIKTHYEEYNMRSWKVTFSI